MEAEKEINKLIEKSIKKEEGWVFPEDAAEEGVNAAASKTDSGDEPEKKENGNDMQAEEAPRDDTPQQQHSTDGPKEFYSLAELTAKVLPPGVDKSKLEVTSSTLSHLNLSNIRLVP